MINLRIQIQQLAKAEEISWRPKSRCLWLKDGDTNTKFFHKIASSNRRHNCMDRLMVENAIIEDKKQIKKKALDFFENLYTEHEGWRPTVSFETINTISESGKGRFGATFWGGRNPSSH